MTPGIEGPLIAPGSSEWMKYMSASKVAAVVGASPWESPFSLFHRMAGNIPPVIQTDEMSRGLYLEDGIASWFADQFPEFAVVRSGTWRSRTHPWMIAAPDRKLYDQHGLAAVLDCKSDNLWWEYGKPGTDEVPARYRYQLLWQCMCTGVERGYLAVLSANLEFQWYVVDFDPVDALWLRVEAEMFLDRLARGENPPIDSHEQTYQAVRELHPDIDPGDVELDEDLARRFVLARRNRDAAEGEWNEARSLVADAMGTAKRARFGGLTVANRQARGGTPFLVAGRKLPDFDAEEAA